MNHLEYYRYYETYISSDCQCSDCEKALTDDNCDFDVTDADTGEYVCDECIEADPPADEELNNEKTI